MLSVSNTLESCNRVTRYVAYKKTTHIFIFIQNYNINIILVWLCMFNNFIVHYGIKFYCVITNYSSIVQVFMFFQLKYFNYVGLTDHFAVPLNHENH